MSITVSIYDFFAYTIPGFLYLYTLSEFLRVLGFSDLNLSTIDFVNYWLPTVILAYISGLLMQFVSYRLWIKLWYRSLAEERAYKLFFAIRPEDDIEFNPEQWPLLFTLIRREDYKTAEIIDKNMATSIMLRNISFGLLLYSILNLYLTFQSVFSLLHLLLAVSMLSFSYISLRRGDYFGMMSYNIVYQHAAYYGKNMNEILATVREAKKSRNKT